MTIHDVPVAGEPATDLLRAELVSARQELDKLRRDLDVAQLARIAAVKDLGHQLTEMARQRDQALTSAESAWNDRAGLVTLLDEALAAKSEADKRAGLLAGINAELLEQVGKQGLQLARLQNNHATCVPTEQGEPSK